MPGGRPDPGMQFCRPDPRHDSNGLEVKKGQPFQEELLIHAIPIENFKARKLKRIFGDPDLFFLLAEEYDELSLKQAVRIYL